MKKLSDIIGKALSKYNLTESAFSLAVIGRFHKHLVDLFGNKALIYAEAKKFQNNTIFVECNSSSWSQEIQLSRQELLNALKKDFPDKMEFGLKIISKQDNT